MISEADFTTAQQVKAARPTKDGSARSYLLAGLVQCALCGRRLDSHWVHGRAGYRCRHGYASSRPRRPDQPKNLYVREDIFLRQLAIRLTSDGNGNHSGDDRSATRPVRSPAYEQPER